MRKVIYKKWIPGVKTKEWNNPGEPIGQFLNKPSQFEEGTNCNVEKEGYFHGFMYDFGPHGEPYANIEHNGEMMYIEADKFKFIDSSENEQLAEFAKAAMQGLLANNRYCSNLAEYEADGALIMIEELSRNAVEIARTILSELKKHKS